MSIFNIFALIFGGLIDNHNVNQRIKKNDANPCSRTKSDNWYRQHGKM